VCWHGGNGARIKISPSPVAELWCPLCALLQKRNPVKKVVPTLQEVKEKICKLKTNKHRLELRKIQIASRALNIDSKIKANEADIMKLTNVEDIMNVDSK